MSTKEFILEVAKEEFLSKGFDNTSLRDIASKCQISATAVYRHFKNKEEIFQSVISPFIAYFNEVTEYIEKTDKDLLNNKRISEVWTFESEGSFHYKLLFGEYNDLVKLIVKERKEWLKTIIVNYEYDATIKYLNNMKANGYCVKDFNLISFKALLDSYFEAYLSILDKQLEKNELFKICNDINDFYTLGFRNLLGF